MDSPDKAALALNSMHFISDTIESISEEKNRRGLSPAYALPFLVFHQVPDWLRALREGNTFRWAKGCIWDRSYPQYIKKQSMGICGLGKWGLEAMAISSKREEDFGDYAVNILPVNILQTIKGKRVYIIHWSWEKLIFRVWGNLSGDLSGVVWTLLSSATLVSESSETFWHSAHAVLFTSAHF